MKNGCILQPQAAITTLNNMEKTRKQCLIEVGYKKLKYFPSKDASWSTRGFGRSDGYCDV